MVNSLFPDRCQSEKIWSETIKARLGRGATAGSLSAILDKGNKSRELAMFKMGGGGGHHQGCFHWLHHSPAFFPNIFLIIWKFHVIYPCHTFLSSHVHSPQLLCLLQKKKKEEKQKERKTATTTNQDHFLLFIYTLEFGQTSSGQPPKGNSSSLPAPLPIAISCRELLFSIPITMFKSSLCVFLFRMLLWGGGSVGWR